MNLLRRREALKSRNIPRMENQGKLKYLTLDSVYKFSHTEKQIISFGYSKIAHDIIVPSPENNEENASTILSTVFWDNENRCWKLKDGSRSSLSSLCTWVYVTRSVELGTGSTFKMFGSKIIISNIK